MLVLELYWTDDKDFSAMEHFLNTFYVSTENAEVRTTTDSELLELVDTEGLAYDYVAIEDPAIVVLIPDGYGDIASAVWESNSGEALGYTLRAAPSIERFNTSWSEPGFIIKSAVGMGEALDPDEMLKDESLEENCTYDQRYEATHTIKGLTYNVVYDVYNNCGDAENSYAIAMAESDPIDQVLFIDFLAATDADVEAFDISTEQLLRRSGAWPVVHDEAWSTTRWALAMLTWSTIRRPSTCACRIHGSTWRAMTGILAMAPSAWP